MADASVAGDGPVVSESRSDKIVTITTAMMSLATAVLLVRLWARYRIQGIASGADEWAILASWAFSLAFTINVCLQTNHGLGKHVADLGPETNFAAALELFFYGEATYYVTVSLTKISILFLYLKVIPQPMYRTISWVMMAFVTLTGFTCVVAGVFQCSPIHKAWHTDTPGTCFNKVALYLANAGLNIAQDLIIYFLPVPTLWKVQLPLKQRVALIAIFVVGAFVCLTGILRLESLTMASVSKDPTWDNYGAAIWSSIESNVGIVCASLVHLKPLIARYAPSMLGIRTTTRLPDERSGGAVGGVGSSDNNNNSLSKQSGNNNSRTRPSKNKPFGILTEMEMEDKYNEEAAMVDNQTAGLKTATTTTRNSSDAENSDGYPRDVGLQRQHSGIQKTTHFTVSYGNREPAMYPDSRHIGIGRGF